MATFRVHMPAVKNVPFPLPVMHKTVNQPFWTLFKRNPDKTYTRISDNAYFTERLAFDVFRDRITAAPLTYSIRPCKIEKPKAGKHKGVTYNPLRDSPLRERVSR